MNIYLIKSNFSNKKVDYIILAENKKSALDIVLNYKQNIKDLENITVFIQYLGATTQASVYQYEQVLLRNEKC